MIVRYVLTLTDAKSTQVVSLHTWSQGGPDRQAEPVTPPQMSLDSHKA